MLIWIIENIFNSYFSRLNIMYSISFRSIASLLSALFISLGVGPYIIIWLRNLHVVQIIRLYGPSSHMLKTGTITMGGIIMLISVFLSIIIWTDFSNCYVWYVLFILIMYAALGLIDDLIKIIKLNSDGLSVLSKYIWQSLIALMLIAVIFIFKFDSINTQLVFLFFKENTLQLGFWYIPLAYFVIVGTSNAVNLSDGLDGLAIIPVILVAIGLSIVSWATSNTYVSSYLSIPYIYLAKELIVICAAIVGSGLGFLWFNAYPAQIFMGDIGSLSFGAAIGLISVLLCQECLLCIMGGIFVIESLSVIFQIGFFKIFRIRIFKMAPIHHHFELIGYSEPKIIVRFWIVSSVFTLLGLFILQI